MADKFKDMPLGASRSLYGARAVSEGDMAAAIAAGDLAVAPLVTDSAGIPDEFDSETNWCVRGICLLHDMTYNIQLPNNVDYQVNLCSPFLFISA